MNFGAYFRPVESKKAKLSKHISRVGSLPLMGHNTSEYNMTKKEIYERIWCIFGFPFSKSVASEFSLHGI
jgi:hypothetical protein